MNISDSTRSFYSGLFRAGGRRGESNPVSLNLNTKRDSKPYTESRQSASTGFKMQQSNVPSVTLRSVSLASGFNFQQADTDLRRLKSKEHVEQSIDFKDRSMQEKGQRLEELRAVLNSLRMRAKEISANGHINNKRAVVGERNVFNATASSDAEEKDYEVTVSSLSDNHRVASYRTFNPQAQLGLSGTIKVNGQVIEIVATDAMATIAEKINRGEDLNYNNQLDLAEDLNGNNTIDSVFVPGHFNGSGYTESFYLNEDINGNGVLDGSEDANGTDMLDGGTAQTGITAHISGNQLMIVSNHGADVQVMFEDPDQILQTIGIIVMNEETYVAEINTSNRNTQVAAKGSIEINGESYTFTDNEITDLIAGVNLDLRKAGYEKVSIETDSEQALKPIVDLIGQYNEAVKFMNNTIKDKGALSENDRLQTIYSDTVYSFLKKPVGITGKISSLADLGIIPKAKEPTSIDQTAFSNLKNLNVDSLSMPGRGVFSLSEKTNSIGINSEDNYNLLINRRKINDRMTNDFESTKSLLQYAASRMQAKLDKHLDENYGTIKFQKDVVGHYAVNETQSIKEMSKSAGSELNGILTHRQTQNIIGAIG